MPKIQEPHLENPWSGGNKWLGSSSLKILTIALYACENWGDL